MSERTDRELCELAARAAEIVRVECQGDSAHDRSGPGIVIERGQVWNPLESDGYALQLAVQLGIDLRFDYARTETIATFGINGRPARFQQCWNRQGGGAGDDPMWATRRVIVRAAAAIGAAQV